MVHNCSSNSIDVSVIIVSFNGQEKLRECLESLFKFIQPTIEVFVSDNGSSDSSVEMVRKKFPSVRIIENNANLGFAAANNRALVKCSGRYIMLLNPDTVFVEDSISKMVRFMDDNPLVGICGPRLLNGNGSLQFSARNFPGVTNQLAESFALQKIFPSSRKLSELVLDPSFYFDNCKPVDWVTGAALMIRCEAFNDIGLLDERFFMYSEEKDWCYRARLKGWPVAFYPGTEIVHLHGDSSTNPKLFGMMMKSKKMFLAKNYGFARARSIMAIMFLNLAVRFAGFYIAAMATAMIAKLIAQTRLQGCLQARSNDRLEGRLTGRLRSRLGRCLGNTASSSFSNRLSVIRAGFIGS